jgi:hypothetical protein
MNDKEPIRPKVTAKPLKRRGAMFILLALAVSSAQAQPSHYNRLLTLAPAQEGTPSGGGTSEAEPGSIHEETLNAHANAATPHQLSADETARQLANPNSPLASLTFKNQLRWYDGDLPGADDQFNYTLLFQPTFPFTMPDLASGAKANLFVRPGIPILVEQPVFNAAKGRWDSASGLGDIGFDIAYGVTEKSGLLWTLGMAGTVPTATDSRFAGKQLRLGPEGLIAKFEKWGLYGVFPSHQWNVTGWKDQWYANTQIQAFLKFLPGDGWSVGSLPIMNYDWRLEQWSIPVNLTIGKTVKVGKTPVKLEIDINYYVKHYDAFGAKWMVGFNITPVVPNFINSWFH